MPLNHWRRGVGSRDQPVEDGMGRVAGFMVAGLLAVAGATAANAAVGDDDGNVALKGVPQRGALGLKRFDADRDLAVTVDEFLKRRVEAFTKRDKNGDGTLDPLELGQAPLGVRQQRQERRADQLLVRLDANADGKLTRSEFENSKSVGSEDGNRRSEVRSIERQKLLFTFYDRNADGVVEKAEYEAARVEETEYAKRRRLHALDRNGDGKVTLEEYTADARFRFLRLDLDRDGRITAADVPPAERQTWSQR
jgi:Ca2+-binding EF-hand superfamily protein